MTDSNAPAPGSDTRAQLVKALTSLKEMRQRLEIAEAAGAARREPIAIIGMGCRLPGADDPDELWQLVRSGTDAISDTPIGRWDAGPLFDDAPDAPGKVATRWGGFLDGIDRFDAAFFGISPREAAQMDPQQRLLLEVAWESLEDAGQSVDRLAGSQTGVFVGVHSHSDDYYTVQSADPAGLDLYSGTGTSHSVISGRLSYLFDFRGPSMAIDTACSSSLVAIHLAVQSLRSGESSLAVAGGVNTIIDPTFTMVASRMRMMSPTGRCRTFDAAADGFVRAEGCATVVLKRLSDAEADGDRIHAVIAGSATNQDGRSNGLTAPNSLSQEAVVRAALDNAGLGPGSVDVVEAHGTGTPLGDPIEIDALSAVFDAADRATPPIALGSLKANIGHAEGAAGVAALIKTVESMRAGEIAPMLHFEQLSPHISLGEDRFVIPTEVTPWPQRGDRRCAGVSSFGWSGTNAHVIVADLAPDVTTAETVPMSEPVASPLILPISARDPRALEALVGAYRDLLVGASDDDVERICATASRRRSHHDHRVAAVGRSSAELIEALDAHLAGQPHRSLLAGRDSHDGGLIAFMLPGQGGQWPGMARDLIETDPTFRDAIQRCADAFAAHVEWDLHEVLADPTGARLDEMDVIQPTLFAVQVALAAVWEQRGVVPDAVIGHSMGEIAAAHIAGALSLDDAACVICVRSSLLRSISGQGAMAVVGLDVPTVTEHLAGYEDRLSVAVSNSASSTVVAGDPDALDELMARWESEETFCRRVKVDVASHSPQVEPLVDDLVAQVGAIDARPANVSFMSTVTAEYTDAGSLGPDYWGRNLRQPVRFGAAVEALIADGSTRFVELGPHPLLVGAVDETLRDAETNGVSVACLRRDSDGPLDMLTALATLYADGASIDWTCVHPDLAPIDLPSYPWQRERHWIERTDAPRGDDGSAAIDAMIHPVAWRRADDATIDRPDHPTSWLLVTCDGADSAALADRLRTDGTTCTVIGLADVDAATVGAASDGHLGVVVLAADRDASERDATDTAQRQVRRITDIIGLAATLDAEATPATMWIVTHGAHVAGDDDRAPGWVDGSLWGVGRSIGDELPHLWGGSIDVDSDADPDAVAAGVAHELAHLSPDGAVEHEVAIRGDARFVNRLVELDRSTDPAMPELVFEETVLITGGFGAVGSEVARWAARHGARHIVLASRTPLTPRDEWSDLDLATPAGRRVALIQDLEALGVDARAATVDVGDEAALRAWLDAFRRDEQPVIRSVFHAAAEFGGELVDAVDAATVERQFMAKSVGAQVFDELELDHLVLFSSVAAVLPVAGQSAYAGANAFVDALAHHRRATGRAAVSINWGFWAESDLADSTSDVVDDTRSIKSTANALAMSRGMHGFGDDDGLAAMGRLMTATHAQALVTPIDWVTFADAKPEADGHLGSDRIRGFTGGDDDAAETAPAAALRDAITAADAADRTDVAEDGVRRIVAEVLRLPADRIDATAAFGSLGLDSLMSIELRNALERAAGANFSATVAWNYPSVRELTGHVLDKLGATDRSDPDPARDDASASMRTAETDELVSNVNELTDDDALAALMGDRE